MIKKVNFFYYLAVVFEILKQTDHFEMTGINRCLDQRF